MFSVSEEKNAAVSELSRALSNKNLLEVSKQAGGTGGMTKSGSGRNLASAPRSPVGNQGHLTGDGVDLDSAPAPVEFGARRGLESDAGSEGPMEREESGPLRLPTADVEPMETPMSASMTAHGPLYYTTMARQASTANYMRRRVEQIKEHFPRALGIDDFMNRVEIALYAYGFVGENSIAMCNLCRDEVCIALKDKINMVFGWSFSTVGIGGVLTCGVSGLKAGLSHSPQDIGKKERYVFFSFPHIAIDSLGRIGSIERPGRDGLSCACGALVNLQGYFNREGIDKALSMADTFEVDDPELSILRSRLARKMKDAETDPKSVDLVTLTKLTEQALTADLELLIARAVNTKIADYAVVTGIQIHNWTAHGSKPGAPTNLEFVAPKVSYVVVNGKRIDVDLAAIPPLTPRQTRLLAKEDQIRRGWLK